MMASQTSKWLATAGVLSMLGGCASGATAQGMTITGSDLRSSPSPNLARTVTVSETSGGKDTNPAWTSQIGDAEFKAALIESLRQAGLLSTTPGSRYVLTAKLTDLEQPIFGFDMTVKSKVRYTLTDKTTEKVVFDEQIAAEHTAKMSDAFVGSTRLQLANEGSARSNIAAMIEKLNSLKLDTQAVSLK